MSAQQTRQRDPYAPIARRFKNETAKHEMTILLDQGLHRHLHFAATSGSAYWFDLVTVPGALIFQGDGESFVFRRVRDMFEFFRSNPDRKAMRINPHYWSEKLTNGRDSVKVYSSELFKQRVKEELDYARESGDRPRGLVKAVRKEILESWEIDHEDSARRVLDEFEFYVKEDDRYDPDKQPDFAFSDTYEWDLKDYDWWFLWACHAIVWGIARYDTARKFAAIDAAPAAAPIVVEVVPRVPAVVNVVPVGGVL